MLLAAKEKTRIRQRTSVCRRTLPLSSGGCAEPLNREKPGPRPRRRRHRL